MKSKVNTCKPKLYDCMWLDEECLKCKYYHVLQTKPFKCPLKKKPHYLRIIG